MLLKRSVWTFCVVSINQVIAVWFDRGMPLAADADKRDEHSSRLGIWRGWRLSGEVGLIDEDRRLVAEVAEKHSRIYA